MGSENKTDGFFVSPVCNFTLQHAPLIKHAVSGCFLSLRKECFAFSRERVVEFSKVDLKVQRIRPAISVKIFGIICCMKKLTNVGESLDSLVVISDSGKMIIPEFDHKKNRFIKIEYELSSESLCARYPGHYLAIDPNGLAILVGALVDTMILFVRSSADPKDLSNFTRMVIDLSGYRIFDMISLNTMKYYFEFAILRSKYSSTDSNKSTEIFIYKYNKALELTNHCIKLNCEAYLLAPILQSVTEDYGVLAFSRNSVMYNNLCFKEESFEVSCHGRVVNSLKCFENPISATYNDSILLVQTKQGDVFEISFYSSGERNPLDIKFLEKLPVARSWCLHNHTEKYLLISSDLFMYSLFKFTEIQITDEENFSICVTKILPVLNEPISYPISDFIVGDFAHKGSSQLYIVSGKDDTSFLKACEQGFDMKLHLSSKRNLKNTSDKIVGAWVIQDKRFVFSDENQVTVFISYANRTEIIVIDVLEDALNKRILDCPVPFDLSQKTLCCIPFGSNEILQVTSSELLLIHKGQIVMHWKDICPIQFCVANQFNVLLYLKNGNLHYFYCNYISPVESKVSRPIKSVVEKVVTFITMGKVRTMYKSPFICLVYGDNVCVLQIFDREQVNVAYDVETLRFSETITSLEILTVRSSNKECSDVSNENYEGFEEYLFVGLKNGTLHKYQLKNYEVINEGMCCLGTKPILLFKISVCGNESLIVQSCQKWIFYYHKNCLLLSPIIRDVSTEFEFIVSYCRKDFENGFLNVSDKRIDIIVLSQFEDIFYQKQLSLTCFPFKILYEKQLSKLIVIERERKFDRDENIDVLAHFRKCIGNEWKEDAVGRNIVNGETSIKSIWRSVIEIIDPIKWRKTLTFGFENNCVAFSACVFNLSLTEVFLILGVLLEYEEKTKRSGIPAVYTLEMINTDKESQRIKASQLKLIGTTFLDGLPSAMCVLDEKILIAEGRHLGIYGFREKSLCVIDKKKFPDLITCIEIYSESDIILVGHSSSISILELSENSELKLLAEKTSTNAISSAICLNDFTYAVVDDEGNFINMSGIKEGLRFGDLLRSKNKKEFELKTHSCLDIGKIAKIQLVKFHANAKPCILYVTFSGSIGVFVELNQAVKNELEKIEKSVKAINSKLGKTNLECSIAFRKSKKGNKPEDGNDLTLEDLKFSVRSEYFIDGDIFEDLFSASFEEKSTIARSFNELFPQDIFLSIRKLKLLHFIWPN